ncbi:hypothetical protein ACSFC1_08920 [Pseudothermotoga sp. U03pept]|uniref:hypothetical protein n=1 Tax=Pseudothermotoga sp. U03pept TaxID=3447012 RepID=UPI003EFBCF25
MNKRLGRGLEVFFQEPSPEQLFQEALNAEETGNWLIAFHLYMKVAEMESNLKSKALNNAAAILAEHGFVEKAIEFLEQAIFLDPSNSQAKENLVILRGDKRK